MATLTLRNLEKETIDRLRVLAAQNGHSMEEEVRRIFRQAVRTPDEKAVGNLGSAIRAIVKEAGGGDVTLPKRSIIRNAPRFGEVS